jgi:response regulator RpfG family c-di-GMP phosphodiesterase
MSEKILFVDDDEHVLGTFRRTLSKHFDVQVALGPEEGLRMIAEQGPFKVVVSDFKMPVMDGIELLARIKEQSPSTVRVMLTGFADLEAAIAAVNEGHVFRFLTKPCSTDTMKGALDAALEMHRLITAERELLRGTLWGSIKMLTEILSLANPEAFGRSERIKRTVNGLAKELQLQGAWKFELAAMLSQIGCVSVPEDIVAKKYSGQLLSPEEQQIYDMSISVAVSLLGNIPRMEGIGQIIACQLRDDCEGAAMSMGGKLLNLAQAYDDLLQQGLGKDDAAARLSQERKRYGEELLSALGRMVLRQDGYSLRQVQREELVPGMVLAEDLRTHRGALMLAKGLELSGYMLERLACLAKIHSIREPIAVLINDGEG